MTKEKNYITFQGLEKLREEYRHLFHDERPKLVETIAWAASNGDRSENADYIYGKRRLREIDRRLRFLNGRIDSAEAIDPASLTSEKVIFGATVEIIDEDEKESCYQIVGEDEVDAARGRISWRSPMGRALLGKAIGDEVILQRPSGKICLEITAISFK
jgi:transcription elongation factor GreB